MSDKNPAVESAKFLAGRGDEEIISTTSGGIRVRLVPVSATLIDEVVSRVKDPDVPMWMNPDKNREEPNPSDPNYLKELAEADRKRGVAAMDAMVMFGVELIDGVPEDKKWLSKLRLMEKRGQIDLDLFDVNDPIDLEFLYKRFIVVDAGLLSAIGRLSGVQGEEVARAEASFQGN